MRVFKLALALLLFVGCKSTNQVSHHSIVNGSRTPAQESLPRPAMWEVENSEYELIVPDVFYADEVQNEQIMPTLVNVPRSSGQGTVSYQINNLIYPTIGNPNLFVKGGEDEELTVVLRIPSDKINPREWDQPEGASFYKTAKREHFDSLSENFRVYLVSRAQRNIIENKEVSLSSAKDGVFRIKPSFIGMMQDTRVPTELGAKKTIVLRFKEADLSALNAAGSVNGLYDIRFEGPGMTEFHYNSVRIFDQPPKENEYQVLNVTDSQNSTYIENNELVPEAVKKQLNFKELTMDEFERFVNYVNVSKDKAITEAAFISFNGDLHNGGSPVTLKVDSVALTYNKEAESILQSLRKLNYPIFLTAGNHDGYASTGQAPAGFLKRKKDAATNSEVSEMTKLLDAQKIPTDVRQRFLDYLEKTKEIPGGIHADIFTGQFIRHYWHQNLEDWQKVDDRNKNHVLYDGFNQWRKTYGPLYTSWRFGKNHYVNINSYDLRQHRRTGWGMYTVNYGGNVSGFQMKWLQKEITKAERLNRDTILLAHHDPRGGHQGKNYPYYFSMIDYQGMDDSAINYVEGEIINPKVCNLVPDWAKTRDRTLGCLHDGLQEWMRADREFDCEKSHLNVIDKKTGAIKCDLSAFDPLEEKNDGKLKKLHSVYSGYVLLNQLTTRTRVRTLLLGHTHFNSVEIHQPGKELVPASIILDPSGHDKYNQYDSIARADSANPIRAISRWFESSDESKTREDRLNQAKAEIRTLQDKGFKKDAEGFVAFHLKDGGHSFERTLQGHELAILRMTSIANLTTQKTQDDKLLFGFSSFSVQRSGSVPGYDVPQINQVTYFQQVRDLRTSQYKNVLNLQLDRSREFNMINDPKNPLTGVFKR